MEKPKKSQGRIFMQLAYILKEKIQLFQEKSNFYGKKDLFSTKMSDDLSLVINFDFQFSPFY